MQQITITPATAGQRLDKFLLKYLNTAPKSFVYKMLRKKNIKLNGKKAEGGEITAEGDVVSLFLADDTIASFRSAKSVKKTRLQPCIIYEDTHLIAANKPAGVPVQGGTDDAENLNDALLYYLSQKGYTFDIYKPGVANRLDRNTGGIVLMPKDLPTAQALAAAFKTHDMQKIYLTVVKGRVDKPGEVSGWHTKDNQNKVRITAEKRDDAAFVKTLYTPVLSTDKYSVLRVELITGKSHQIRESMNFISHPIIGDPKYGDAAVNRFFKQKFGLDHQLLYAVSLTLKTDNAALAYLNGKRFACSPDAAAERILEYITDEKYDIKMLETK